MARLSLSGALPDRTDPVETFIVIFLLAFIVFAFIMQDRWAKKKNAEKEGNQAKLNNYLMNRQGFSPKQTFNGLNGSYIGLDAHQNFLIQVSSLGKPELVAKSEFLEADLEINELGVSKVKRGNQIVGALAGGVIAGGVGAIIGAMGSTSVSNQNINTINLRLATVTGGGKVFTVPFYRGPRNGLPITSSLVKDSLDKARLAVLMINNAMAGEPSTVAPAPRDDDRRYTPSGLEVPASIVDQVAAAPNAPDRYTPSGLRIPESAQEETFTTESGLTFTRPAKDPQGLTGARGVERSEIEELTQLAQLKADGVITDEEFINLKNKILNR